MAQTQKSEFLQDVHVYEQPSRQARVLHRYKKGVHFFLEGEVEGSLGKWLKIQTVTSRDGYIETDTKFRPVKESLVMRAHEEDVAEGFFVYWTGPAAVVAGLVALGWAGLILWNVREHSGAMKLAPFTPVLILGGLAAVWRGIRRK